MRGDRCNASPHTRNCRGLIVPQQFRSPQPACTSLVLCCLRRARGTCRSLYLRASYRMGLQASSYEVSRPRLGPSAGWVGAGCCHPAASATMLYWCQPEARQNVCVHVDVRSTVLHQQAPDAQSLLCSTNCHIVPRPPTRCPPPSVVGCPASIPKGTHTFSSRSSWFRYTQPCARGGHMRPSQ